VVNFNEQDWSLSNERRQRHSNTAKTRASISCPLDSIHGLTERAGKPRRDDEDDEYDGPRDELRYAAVQLGLSAAVLGG